MLHIVQPFCRSRPPLDRHSYLPCPLSKFHELLFINERNVLEAYELILRFCSGFERHYGHEACTANMHMHCHLKDCILDMGPLLYF